MKENDVTNSTRNITTTNANLGGAEDGDWTEEDLAYWKAQHIIEAIILKVVSILSAIGSSYIIYKLVFDVKSAADRRKKLFRSFDRMLLCLCVADLISSIAFFLGSWLVPADPPSNEYQEFVSDAGQTQDGEIEFPQAAGTAEPLPWDIEFPHAAGTTGTCTAQGFIVFFGLMAGMLFTGCISLTFLFQVKFEFREMQMRMAEKWFFTISTLTPLVMCFVLLADHGYHPSPDLAVCLPSTRYNFLFTMILAAATTVVIIVCMAMLFWSVRTRELRAARWSTIGTSAVSRGVYSKKVFIKSMLYIGAFLIIWVPALVTSFTLPKYSGYFGSILWPLQGVLNALIYSDLINNAFTGFMLFLTRNLKAAFLSLKSTGTAANSKHMESSAAHICNSNVSAAGSTAHNEGDSENDGYHNNADP